MSVHIYYFISLVVLFLVVEVIYLFYVYCFSAVLSSFFFFCGKWACGFVLITFHISIMSIPGFRASLRHLPVGINGIGVCLCGIGALFRVFIPIYSNGSNANEIIILLLSSSLLLASLYILKSVLHFNEAISSDWNLPLQIGGIGSLSIAFSVQGSLFNDPVAEPSLSLYWLLLATAFIALENIILLRPCIINNVPPELVYNTSVFNCFFVPALLPSNPYYCVVI